MARIRKEMHIKIKREKDILGQEDLFIFSLHENDKVNSKVMQCSMSLASSYVNIDLLLQFFPTAINSLLEKSDDWKWYKRIFNWRNE